MAVGGAPDIEWLRRKKCRPDIPPGVPTFQSRRRAAVDTETRCFRLPRQKRQVGSARRKTGWDRFAAPDLADKQSKDLRVFDAYDYITDGTGICLCNATGR